MDPVRAADSQAFTMQLPVTGVVPCLRAPAFRHRGGAGRGGGGGEEEEEAKARESDDYAVLIDACIPGQQSAAARAGTRN